MSARAHQASYEQSVARSVAWHRQFDRYAMESLKIPGIVLMENAGRNAAAVIREEFCGSGHPRVTILCGPGNNGGDGFVIARHLANAGLDCHIVLASSREKLKGDAESNFKIVECLELPLHAAENEIAPDVALRISTSSVIVDALLGTGVTGNPRGSIAALIRLANSANDAHRVAIDVPTGLDADTGDVAEPCFQAALTITMLAPKPGFERAKQQVGTLKVVDIGVSPETARFKFP
ncbi:MAG: NAD(P)H-hydrate epimerase [Phycisphaerae bacterium]